MDLRHFVGKCRKVTEDYDIYDRQANKYMKVTCSRKVFESVDVRWQNGFAAIAVSRAQRANERVRWKRRERRERAELSADYFGIALFSLLSLFSPFSRHSLLCILLFRAFPIG